MSYSSSASKLSDSAGITICRYVQAAMWTKTVWPLLSRRQQEKEQPSSDALITLLWDQLVSFSSLCTSLLPDKCTSYHG